MSGDVQPRKRKDKKRKKEELGVEEPRGTAAALGEGDVFIHSHHDHGTGGHWCAKIIFFSLLAVLVTLIGLIILENRGLSDLEANSVESRYSGVLEGWLEDAPDDDHHDEHTLELNHPDDDEDDHGHDDDSEELEDDHDDEDENDDEHDEEEDELNQSDDGDDQESNEQQDATDSQEDNDEVENFDHDDQEEDHHRKYYDDEETENDGDDDEQQENESEETNEHSQADGSNEEGNDSTENDIDEENELNDESEEGAYNEEENAADNEDEEEHDEEDEEDTEVEIEKIEKEIDLEPISTELPALPEDDDDDNDKSEELSTDAEDQEKDDEDDGVAPEDLDDDFLEDDSDEPPIERITAPVGKPFVEVEEEDSSEKPPDTLAEEEEYEKQQEERKREEEKSSHKDGGNSVEDEWPGEPSDAFWRQELDSAEDDLRRGSWGAAEALASDGALRGSARARWLRARAADRRAEAERDNAQLGRAIAAYLHLLKMHDCLSDDKLKLVTERALDRIMFRGSYLSAEPVYRLLIRRFPEEVGYRNNLTISFLMANRADLAEEILKETIKKWPTDRVALAHYGFVLKTLRNRLEEAVEAFQKALEGDTGPANEPRFYYHLGDALLLLGRPAEAHEVHKRGAKLGHFLSPAQRSLYNVPRLKGQPWWNTDETPYTKLARSLEQNWKEILKEGEAAKALYEKEREGLQERGDWSQLDLFARGQEIPNRCKNAPVTCSIVRSEPAAVGCRRGQIKFSAMAPGTHVRAHVGPTNCRLRMHLALSNTKNTFLRVDQTVRQWQVGKVLMFDDSFEHEVWHNGSAARLVLIVDVWHPELTPRERRALPAI